MCTVALPGTHPAGAQRCKRTGPESCGAAFRDEQGHRNKNESKEESGEPQRVETGHDLMSSWEFHPETLKFVFRITQDLKPKIAPHERKDQQRTARVKQHLVHDHHLEPQPVTWRLWGVTPYHSQKPKPRLLPFETHRSFRLSCLWVDALSQGLAVWPHKSRHVFSIQVSGTNSRSKDRL